MMIGEVLAYLAVIGAGGLILFVYGRRPSEPIGPSLLLLLGALFLWALGELLRLYVAETPSSYWYALVVAYSGALLVTPAWWLLALGFAEIHGRPLRWVGFKLPYAPLRFAAVLWGVVLTVHSRLSVNTLASGRFFARPDVLKGLVHRVDLGCDHNAPGDEGDGRYPQRQ